MGEIDLYNINSSPNFGIVLAVLSIIPWVLTYTLFKPKFRKVKNNNKEIRLEIANIIIYITNIILLIAYRNKFDIKTANIWFGIMIFFYLIYYELYIRYIVRGRAQKELYMPFMYVKVPFFIAMSLSIVFAAIWAKCVPLIYFSILFTITNCYISYKKYMNYFTEYRDLYDENRNPTGRKMLMDGIRPKGLKYVTVIALIYNPKNQKWLMQKRTKDKGGQWATTSGHPIAGKSSIEGMITEINEELGLKVDKDELKLINTIERREKFADIYYLEKEINVDDLVLQKEEVDDVMWMSTYDIDAFYNAKKFKKTHYNYFKESLRKMKK